MIEDIAREIFIRKMANVSDSLSESRIKEFAFSAIKQAEIFSAELESRRSKESYVEGQDVVTIEEINSLLGEWKHRAHPNHYLYQLTYADLVQVAKEYIISSRK